MKNQTTKSLKANNTFHTDDFSSLKGVANLPNKYNYTTGLCVYDSIVIIIGWLFSKREKQSIASFCLFCFQYSRSSRPKGFFSKMCKKNNAAFFTVFLNIQKLRNDNLTIPVRIVQSDVDRKQRKVPEQFQGFMIQARKENKTRRTGNSASVSVMKLCGLPR